MSHNVPPRKRRLVYGVVGIGVVLALVGLALGTYTKVLFSPVVWVTVNADRAGLLMDRGGDVRLRGIPVGEVRSVELRPDGGTAIRVALRPDQVKSIPAGATAEIKPATPFGGKHVDLLAEDGPVRDAIRAESVIEARRTTVEINDVFAGAHDVLTTVKPAKLNAALGGLAKTLDGRGAELGNYIGQLNAYLKQFEPNLGTLRADLDTGADVMNIYADAAPDLLRLAGNASVTSQTLTEIEPALHEALLDFTRLSGNGEEFFTRVGKPLITTLDVLNPTMALLARYSPAFTCDIVGLDEMRRRREVASADQPGIQGNASFVPMVDGYKPGRNEPKFVGGGPTCGPLPYVRDDQMPLPYRYLDDGTHAYEGDYGVTNPPIPLGEMLFGGAR